MSTRLVVVFVSLFAAAILTLRYGIPTGQGAGVERELEELAPGDQESPRTHEAVVDGSRLPLHSAATTQMDASTAEGDLELDEPAYNTPLERLLHPNSGANVSELLKNVQDSDRPHQSRLMAAQFAMAASVAMRMEIAGTGSPGRPQGGISPHPAELFQFTHNGRDYFFERGEFPVWDEVEDLLEGARTKRNRGEELAVRESLYLEVQELAEQVVQAVEDYNRRDD